MLHRTAGAVVVGGEVSHSQLSCGVGHTGAATSQHRPVAIEMVYLVHLLCAVYLLAGTRDPCQ
jgi:hypothetical protein